jgi:hypothetical protein
LVLHDGYYFAWRQDHRSTTKSGQIWVAWVSTYGDLMLLGGKQCLFHDDGIASMKTTGDTSLIDKGHDLIVEAHCPSAEAFAEVAI